tara:strand:- start:586 stop:804 length:219 start_codon:yes stop_codon:yes gene_type:complete
MRSQKKLPEDPNAFLVDFFGQYRDPIWDRMEEWKGEMDTMREEIPDLQEKVDQLMKTIEIEKRRTAAFDCYQ